MDGHPYLSAELAVALDPQFLWNVLLVWDAGKACLLSFSCRFNPVVSKATHRKKMLAAACGLSFLVPISHDLSTSQVL